MKRVLIYPTHAPVVVESPDEVTHTVIIGGEAPHAVIDPSVEDISIHLSDKQREQLASHLPNHPGVL